MMRIFKAISMAVAASMLLTGSVVAGDFAGAILYVVDGDTFDVSTQGTRVRIRLCGIDAPERGETGYTLARDALVPYIGKSVRCVQVGQGTPCDGRSKATNHGRVVAQCFVNGGDIAAWLVNHGYAVDWPRFSGGHYANR